jgi:hypothetical protein
MLRPVPGAKQRNVSVPQNAAPEWQARILCRSQILLEACTLEGLVIRSSTPRYFSEVLPEQAS